jgi:hypothetical protein
MVLLVVPNLLLADEPTAEQLRFYETSIRPLLAKNCYECHSAKAKKLKGKLRLDARDHLLKGGETGLAVVPGKPDESLLIKAVRYDELEMPPRGKLSDKEINLLAKWIQIGAPFPAGSDDDTGARRRAEFTVSEKDKQYWAYQPIRRPKLPVVDDSAWALNAVDRFILQRAQSNDLSPNGPASPRELIRRAYFDLIGIPPTPEEIVAFEQASIRDPHSAFRILIDNLLARPQYGERWGRHWLDTVRYGQTNGYERDDEKVLAWRYRDYVIKAFNDDKPFDQFVIEQLAGDEFQKLTDDSVTATGFYRLGVWDDEPDDQRAAEYDGLDDILSTIGQVFLGQTIGCARCHNHMFDPIPHEDYYRMLAFVRNVKQYVKPGDKAAGSTIFTNLPSGAGRALTVREHGRDAAATHLLIRGDAGTPSHEVQPGVFQVLSASKQTSAIPLPAAVEGRSSSGRRTALAKWIANSENPLTARVIANRVWQHHFGRGIVKTPNDFGRAGLPPTHPKLLDWLAAELIAGEWSIKNLHRTIMLSNAYRMSSRATNAANAKRDPGNDFFWRQNMRRLDAESIRDSILAVAGQLNHESGGRGAFPRLSGEVVAGQSKPGRGWDVSPAAQRNRRSVYMFVKRGLRNPMMEAFDYVNTAAPLGVRPTTTVAPQALILLNSRFMFDQSAALTERILRDVGDDSAKQIERLFRLAMGRAPTGSEMATAGNYLRAQQRQFMALADQITFRPNVPTSLFKEYRAKLSPEEHLLGPRSAWSYHSGVWGGGYEGIDVVDIHQTPFALWQGLEFADGAIHGKLKLHNASERATLLVRASPSGSAWHGYSIELDPRGQSIALVRRAGKTDTLRVVKTQVAMNVWHNFRIELAGNRLQFWLGDDEAPILDVVDAQPVASGRFGLSTWGAALSLDKVQIESSGSKWDVARFLPAVVTKNSSGMQGWSRFGGQWINSSDGHWTVGVDRGAKVVWDEHSIENGEVSVEMRFSPGRAQIGGLILRVREPKVGADNWFGYEVSLDAARQTVFIGDHRNNWTKRAEAAAKIEPGRWHRLRVVMAGPKFQLYVDGADRPLVEFADTNPLATGAVGLRTWGSEVAFRNLVVTKAGKKLVANFRPPKVQVIQPARPTTEQQAHHRALQSLCQVLLNLNEFVYVD